MGVAIVLVSASSVRHFVANPEVRVEKEGRAQLMRDNHAEGESWVKLGKSLRGDTPVEEISIMPDINKRMA